MWRNLIMVLALTCLVLLGWYAVQRYPSRIEADLEARVQLALEKRGLSTQVSVTQRDVTLSGQGSAQDIKASKEAALEVAGLHSVRDDMKVAEEAKAEIPAVQLVEAKPSEDVVAQVEVAPEATDAPAEDTAEAAEAVEATDLPAADVGEAKAEADTAAAEVVAADTEKAVEADKGQAIPATGALTPAQCKALLAEMFEPPHSIDFRPNTGRLTPEGEAQVAQAWEVLKRCPEAKGVIECHHDNYGDPDRLHQMTHIRAYQVHKTLVSLGMDKSRFSYLGKGFQEMKYGVARETRALNRRVEFNITVE